MKTILIVVAGMSDLPDPLTGHDTPLTEAHIPALDILSQRGSLTSFFTLPESFTVSHSNALLSLLGYDLERGEPDVRELMEFGLDNSKPLTSFDTLRPFIIPGFSGHGVCVTASAWVRGVAKCAMLRPLDIYSPGSSDSEILDAIAALANQSITKEEFVFVYVDSPLRSSLKGDVEGKIHALELIDRHLISPMADFVWKSDLLINMAITTDLVTPWHRRRPAVLPVPVTLYFNNWDNISDEDNTFTEVCSMLTQREFLHPSDLIRYLISFSPDPDSGLDDKPF